MIMAASPIDIAGTVRRIQSALDHANGSQDWVLLVCPNADITQSILSLIASVIPAGTRFSGRTLVTASGGRMSVVKLGDDLPGPDTQKFIVGMLGWGSVDMPKEAGPWVSRAIRFLTT